jgi:hypothetical protein
VDPLFPFIQVPPPASHGASATAAFYKALETGAQHSGRRVKIDYSQSAIPHDKGRGGRFQSTNDGTRDIGNSQSPVLLFRGLDPLSGPQAIAQAMKTSSGIGKEGAKGMKRIILIKDKVTLGSWGFAFVEFVDQQVMFSPSVLEKNILFSLLSLRQLHLPRRWRLRSTLMGFVSPTDRWQRPSPTLTHFSLYPITLSRMIHASLRRWPSAVWKMHL